VKIGRRGFLKLAGGLAVATIAAPVVEQVTQAAAFIPSERLDMGVPRPIATAKPPARLYFTAQTWGDPNPVKHLRMIGDSITAGQLSDWRGDLDYRLGDWPRERLTGYRLEYWRKRNAEGWQKVSQEFAPSGKLVSPINGSEVTIESGEIVFSQIAIDTRRHPMAVDGVHPTEPGYEALAREYNRGLRDLVDRSYEAEIRSLGQPVQLRDWKGKEYPVRLTPWWDDLRKLHEANIARRGILT